MVIKNPTELKGHQESSDLEDFEKEDDETGRRIVTIRDSKYNVVQLDPHGFWEIRSTGGRLPRILKDQKFTTPTDAELAITKYLASNGKDSNA